MKMWIIHVINISMYTYINIYVCWWEINLYTILELIIYHAGYG